MVELVKRVQSGISFGMSEATGGKLTIKRLICLVQSTSLAHFCELFFGSGTAIVSLPRGKGNAWEERTIKDNEDPERELDSKAQSLGCRKEGQN